MSSIVSLEIAGSDFATQIVGENLEIIGQQGQENIIEVEGDSPITIIGGALADEVTAGAGDASIFGGDGNDTIMGGIGDDILQGGEGDDSIEGGMGADFIFGGAGNDTITSGLPGMDSDGDPMGDILSGGDGADVFEFAAKEFETGATDQIVDFQADDFADAIRIFGVSEEVSYNANSGMVSIDGKEVIDIGEGLDIDVEQQGDSDTWELF